MALQEIETQVNPLSLIESIEIAQVTETIKKVATLQATVKGILKKGFDYNTIPGCGDKPTLLKPGAEKILMAFGLVSEYQLISETEDFNNNGFFAYTVKCILLKGHSKITEGLGHANSKEAKWAYKWVYEKDIPEGLTKNDLPKKEYTSKNGGKYYKYRVDEDANSKANTILKMAKKRAQVDAVLTVASLSEIFTQDLEDMAAEYNYENSNNSESANVPNGKIAEDKAKVLHKILDTYPGVEYELRKKYNIDSIEDLQEDKFFSFKKEAEKSVKEWDTNNS
jgi:hypothetical protein